MKCLIYLLITAMILIIFAWGFVFISTILDVSNLGNKVSHGLVAAGWAGFPEVDFDKLAKRKVISNEEDRDVYIIESEAVNKVTEYIKKNLNLDDSFFATSDSYIAHKEHPVIISEIAVYNPDDLPATCSRGETLNRTTIHIIVRIPADIRFIGFRYFEKHVDVDTKSFYKD